MQNANYEFIEIRCGGQARDYQRLMNARNTSNNSIGIIQTTAKDAPQKRKRVKRLVTSAAIDAGTKKKAKIPIDRSSPGITPIELSWSALGKAISRLTAVQVNVKIQLILAALFEGRAISVL
jgi:hypothetical protein